METRIFAITDRHLFETQEAYWHQLEEVAASGVDAMVLREKDLLAEEYELISRQFIALCEAAGCKPIVHGFSQLWSQLSLQWAHAPLPLLRGLTSAPPCRVGVSVHSKDEAQEAMKLFAAWGTTPAYFLVSNIYETSCKPGAEGKGVKLLAVVKEVAGNTPLIALGGINAANAGEVVAAGAQGIALRSALMLSNNPAALVQELRSLLDSSLAN